MKNLVRDQVAIMNIQYKYFPLEKFLDDAISNNVKNIELWGATPHFHLEDLSYHEVKQVRHAIEKRGLKLVCLTPEQCVYPINLASDNVQTRRRSQRFFADHIRVCSELGCQKMLVTSGTGYFDDQNIYEAWSWAAENLLDLSELAKEHGVTLALEVLRRDESNLVYNLPTLLRMLEELNHPSIGGMIDTIPMALAEERPVQYLEALGNKLVHVHFIDGAPRGHLAWGDGVLDMHGYLQEFDDYAYQNYFSLEITDGRYFMNPTGSVEQSIAKLYEVLE